MSKSIQSTKKPGGEKYILKAQQIEQMPGEKKTHFLNANAVRLNKSLGDAVGLQNIGVHLIYVEPGFDSTEYHRHVFEEECLYLLSGSGVAMIDGESYRLEAGDFLGLPSNRVAHSLFNDGSETLVCLVMGQRLTHDVADYPNVGKRLYRNRGEWDLVELAHIDRIRSQRVSPSENS